MLDFYFSWWVKYWYQAVRRLVHPEKLLEANRWLLTAESAITVFPRKEEDRFY